MTLLSLTLSVPFSTLKAMVDAGILPRHLLHWHRAIQLYADCPATMSKGEKYALVSRELGTLCDERVRKLLNRLNQHL